MSRFKSLYLQQGSKKFNVGYVELEIQKTLGRSDWEITLMVDDVWGIYKAWNKNQIFMLYAEWTLKSHGVTLSESISGTFIITDIGSDKKPFESGKGSGYPLHGVSPNLTVSGIPDNERVKVMFD